MEVTSYLTDERTLGFFQGIARTICLNLACPPGLPDGRSFAAGRAALGFGRLTVHKLIEPLIPEPERAKPKENTSNLLDSVVVGDTTGILYTLAACCKPIWGDEVVGYITRSRGTAKRSALVSVWTVLGVVPLR